MKPVKGVKLVSAKYVSDYKYHFVFSDGKESVVDFKPIINHGTMCKEYLDVSKFKKMKFDKERGDIYWGKDWDMCFHIDAYYGESKLYPLLKKELVD